MPVPYRKTPRAAEIGQAAYLDIHWLPSENAFLGGLLILDGKGQPQEFVHNRLVAPSGLLWPEASVRRIGVATLTHSLFDACRREPDLLVCRANLGTLEYLKTEIAPSIPFVQMVPAQGEVPAEWNWVNEPPSSAMRASLLAQELARRGFILEPFVRLQEALRLVYPEAAWEEDPDDELLG